MEWVGVFLIAATLAIVTALSAGGRQLSYWLFDQQVAWTAPPVDDRILLVAIDEASLAKVGDWPWPRARHAELIDRLGAARAIGYDVLFNEPTSIADDAALAEAMARNGRVTVPLYVRTPGSDGLAFEIHQPIPAIGQAANAVGHVNIHPDSDGLERRVELLANGQPHFSVSLLESIDALGPVSAGELVIPYHPLGAFPLVSAHTLLDGEVPEALLQDRIVLVGTTAAGLDDSHAVPGPAGSVMPGVEVQANIINAQLNGFHLRDLGPALSGAAAVALLLATMLLFWRVSPSKAFWLTIAAGLGLTLLSTVALAVWQLWLTPVPFVAGMAVAYPMWSWRRLSALNRFISQETRAMTAELEPKEGPSRSLAGFDGIALAANRLHAVIGELRDRRRFLSDVIESSPDAVVVVDNQGVCRMANRTAKQILGPDIEGSPLAELFLGVSLEASLGSEEFTTREGATFLRNSAPLAANGKEGGQIIRLADITARRIAERDREDLLEFLSHDMRAPQASIVNLIEAANGKTISPDLLDRISDNARFSLKLADDFVQLARLSSTAPNLEPVDLAALADEASDRAYTTAAALGVTIEVRCEPAVPLASADPWLLIRVLGNLLDNAIKFSPPGQSVTCTIASADGGTRVTCSIIDRGPGIEAERQESLFERFGSVDSSKGRSAGLGLAFVKKAMDSMGGTIECRTSPDGTSFELGFDSAGQAELA